MTGRREPEAAELVELERVDGGPRLPAKPIAAAGLLVLAALVLAVSWRPGPAGLLTGASPVPSRSVVVGPSRTATPGIAASWAWQPVPLSDFGAERRVADVWGVGSVLVAVLASPFDPVASLLISSQDGIHWVDAGLPVGPSMIVAGTVGNGRLSVLAASPDGGDPTLFATTDGAGWEWLGSVAGLLGTGDTVEELRASAHGWVAVVSDGSGPSAGAMSLRYSPDGLTWEPVGPRPEGFASLTGLADNGRGWVVAGVDLDEDPRQSQAGALASADGVDWEWHPIETDVDVFDLTYGVAGYVAVGWDPRRYRGRSWYSADGVAWLPSTVEPLPPMEAAPITDIIAVDGGYLAFSVITGDAWLCPDGVKFWPYPVIDVYDFDGVAAVAALGDVMIAGGWQSNDVPTVWVGSLTQMLDSPGGIGVVGSGI